MYGVPPYLYIVENDLKRTSGITIDIMNILANYYGFQYDIVLSNEWWFLRQNGSLGGALGLVSAKSVVVSKLFSKTPLLTPSFWPNQRSIGLLFNYHYTFQSLSFTFESLFFAL